MKTTGTEILGVRLFADAHAINKLIRKLPADVRAYVRSLRTEKPDADEEWLRGSTHAAFSMQPLQIGEIRSIKIETKPRRFLNEYAIKMSGFLHEAEIPYVGHPTLWRQQMLVGARFPFQGKVSPSTVRLRTFIDGENYWQFKADVEAALSEAREMLRITEASSGLLAEQTRCAVDKQLAAIFGT